MEYERRLGAVDHHHILNVSERQAGNDRHEKLFEFGRLYHLKTSIGPQNIIQRPAYFSSA